MNDHITKECLYRHKSCSFCHQEYLAAREMVGYKFNLVKITRSSMKLQIIKSSYFCSYKNYLTF